MPPGAQLVAFADDVAVLATARNAIKTEEIMNSVLGTREGRKSWLGGTKLQTDWLLTPGCEDFIIMNEILGRRMYSRPGRMEHKKW
jgi:hypothetical protein